MECSLTKHVIVMMNTLYTCSFMHVLNVLKIYVTNIEKNGFFFRLNVILRVLEIFDHFGGLLNHSILSGICQIV